MLIFRRWLLLLAQNWNDRQPFWIDHWLAGVGSGGRGIWRGAGPWVQEETVDRYNTNTFCSLIWITHQRTSLCRQECCIVGRVQARWFPPAFPVKENKRQTCITILKISLIVSSDKTLMTFLLFWRKTRSKVTDVVTTTGTGPEPKRTDRGLRRAALVITPHLNNWMDQSGSGPSFHFLCDSPASCLLTSGWRRRPAPPARTPPPAHGHQVFNNNDTHTSEDANIGSHSDIRFK